MHIHDMLQSPQTGKQSLKLVNNVTHLWSEDPALNPVALFPESQALPI